MDSNSLATYNPSDPESPTIAFEFRSPVIHHFTNENESNSTCVNFTMWKFEIDSCGYIFNVYLTIPLCFIGFLGNFFTIAVLQRDRDPQRQKTTNWLLEILAIVDCICLAFAFVFLPISTIAFRTNALPTVRKMFPYLMVYLYPFMLIAQIVTIWIVVFVTVDRYLAICKPLHTEWRSLRRVKMAVLVLFILAVIYNIPRFFELELIPRENCKDGEIIYISSARHFVFNIYYLYIYEAGCDFVLRSVGPLVILVILNVRISCAIKALNKKRREMTLQAKEEKTLTVMIIVVVIVFVICQLPFTALSFAFPAAAFFPVTENWKEFHCAFATADALIMLNCAVNFLIYCLIWRKFNRILVRIMTCSKEEAAKG